MDYLKRSIAYLGRRVYNCANETSHFTQLQKLAQPWTGLGPFCQR